MLKNPIRIYSKDNITDMMYTCAILHNMLLTYDGFDKLWTEEDWLSLDPVESDEENDGAKKTPYIIRPERLQEYHLPTAESEETTIIETGHTELKRELITNLKYLYDKSEVEHLQYPNKRARA